MKAKLLILSALAFVPFSFWESSGPALDPDVAAWNAAVIAAGSSISGGTLTAANTLVLTLKADGVWAKCYMIDLCCGADLTAALIRLKVPGGVARAMTNHNFTGGMYSEATGLHPNGSTTYLDTGINPVAQSWSVTNGMIHAYARTAESGGSKAIIGCQDGGNNLCLLGWLSSGTTESGMWANRFLATGSVTSLTGLLTAGVVSGPFEQFYQNASGFAAGVSQIDGFSNTDFYLYNNGNVGGGFAGYCARYVAGTFITQTLNSTELTDFYNALQAFETALGRQV